MKGWNSIPPTNGSATIDRFPTLLSRLARGLRTAGMGHEERFPSPSLSGRCRVPRYLAEFEYRFNRRYDLAAMMPRLGYVAVRTPPMPYRLNWLKIMRNQVVR